MKAPLFVRSLTDAEHERRPRGLRAPAACTLCGCQLLLASGRGAPARRLVDQLGCSNQAARDALGACNDRGLAAPPRRSARPATTYPVCDVTGTERRRELQHHSPRNCGHETSVWAPPLAAEVGCAEGLTAAWGSGETVGATPRRRGVRRQRATRWIVSPARRTSERKSARPPAPPRGGPPGLVPRLRTRPAGQLAALSNDPRRWPATAST